MSSATKPRQCQIDGVLVPGWPPTRRSEQWLAKDPREEQQDFPLGLAWPTTALERIWARQLGVMTLPIYGKIIKMFQTTSSEIYKMCQIIKIYKNQCRAHAATCATLPSEKFTVWTRSLNPEKKTQKTTWLLSCANMMKNINILQDGFSLCWNRILVDFQAAHAATMSLRTFIRTRGCGCNWLFGSSTCHGANMFQPNCICRRKNLWQICSRSDPVTSQYVYPCISSNTNVILMFLILDLDAAIDTLCIAS